jgi:nucleotide-binding universal stress UspA family protein
VRLALLVPVAALVLTGCSQAEEAASNAASEAASRAAGAAADQVRGQICQRLQDGQVSAQDKQVLSGLVEAARSAGVPEDITGPLGQVAQSGDQVPAEAVGQLQQACQPGS